MTRDQAIKAMDLDARQRMLDTPPPRWLVEAEREAMDHEAGARYDDVAERFSGEIGTCPVCGGRTTDPMGCCEGRPEAAAMAFRCFDCQAPVGLGTAGAATLRCPACEAKHQALEVGSFVPPPCNVCGAPSTTGIEHTCNDCGEPVRGWVCLEHETVYVVRMYEQVPGGTVSEECGDLLREARFSCECEHAVHFDSTVDSEAHRYGAILPTDAIATTYGRFNVCDACRDAGHMAPRVRLPWEAHA